jgi:hypothetical protein
MWILLMKKMAITRTYLATQSCKVGLCALKLREGPLYKYRTGGSVLYNLFLLEVGIEDPSFILFTD